MFLYVLQYRECTAVVRSTFYAQNPALDIVDRQKSVKMSIYTYMHKGNVQQKNPLRAASCVAKNISPRFSPTSTPMYSSKLYAKNPVFEIVHEESVKVYHLHIHVQRED